MKNEKLEIRIVDRDGTVLKSTSSRLNMLYDLTRFIPAIGDTLTVDEEDLEDDVIIQKDGESTIVSVIDRFLKKNNDYSGSVGHVMEIEVTSDNVILPLIWHPLTMNQALRAQLPTPLYKHGYE